MSWRPVAGYEDRYEVSDAGDVRSMNFRRTNAAKLLTPKTDSHGYFFVCLYDGTGRRGRKSYSVHRLVTAAFIGPRPNGYDINHKDGVPTNNALVNLEYVTRSENLRHAFRIGLMSVAGDKNPRRIAAARRKASQERWVAPFLG